MFLCVNWQLYEGCTITVDLTQHNLQTLFYWPKVVALCWPGILFGNCVNFIREDFAFFSYEKEIISQEIFFVNGQLHTVVAYRVMDRIS